MSRTDDVIDRYAAGGPLLAYAVAGLSADDEQAHPGPGAWSIAQLVTHLLDSDLVYADRMRWVIAEHEPPLPGFDENAWIDRLGGEAMPVEESVNLFTANRQRMARILRRCSEDDFSRAGLHAERGRMTLAELLATITNHVDHHLRFLYAKRANLGVAVPPRYTAP
jgi:uncharacterized damage-inducible protein DinB